ncbi:MAG: PD-(D/E)XK nuclease domain-containing protein, partial [Lachnospiraceae bacterium]|nr:PD-(D/E)XK nuclease domain-containing protein [Lachnospiraceae bacterium]
LWSILFTTGYLTQCGNDDNGLTSLVIPNREIQWIYKEQIQDWFEAETRKDTKMLESFCRAFEENNTDVIEKSFTAYLRKTISIRDTNVKKEMKENFYHGILLGLFAGMKGWKVKSNAESGDGYSDISIEVDDKEIGIIIELKYAEKADFDNGCSEALKQINDRNYEEALIDDGMTTIRKYGIACYKKRCRVISGQ